MCGIAGLEGNFKGNDLLDLLKSIKHRGPDSTGIYLKEEGIKNDIDLDNLDLNNNYTLAKGHNLLSIYNQDDFKKGFQPISYKNLTLVYNGEIYNTNEISDFLNLPNDTSDDYILIKLIYFFYYKHSSLLTAMEYIFEFLDGDYAFAVYDGENLAVLRDPLGMRPLFYSISGENKAFASEKIALKNLDYKDIKSLKPGCVLYNWKEFYFENDIWDEKIDIGHDYLNDLESLLTSSILKRIKNIDEIGLIFSGGVDSTIIAYILKEIQKERDLTVKLYVVGDENSQDIVYSKKIAKILGFDLKIQNINEKIVKDNLNTVLDFLGENNLMKIGVAMTVYLASNLIRDDGLRVGLTGQGADELFAGYNRYLKTYKKGLKELDYELRYDISNMYNVNLERDDAACMKSSIELRSPYLDKNFVKYSLNIPVNLKISSEDDKLRKNILRKLAIKLNIPKEFANRPKKAAQYGSGIDKILRKKCLDDINDYFLM
ncbi:asparagine synthetase B family protein [Methanobrevibacter sp. DSM 116169]|uniref:asparagine synthetase B family protein n=1 Tax=Methanobrevibacter sp. DSM 116169 TaxID=3242727 RepID=UPI0038FC24D2